jgi:DNA-binding transcriptional ArsR family regulator
MRRFDVLLHPVRMQILFEITGGRMTAKQLGERLKDIPQATLYRHLKALSEAGVLEVVEENPVRGTVERVYALGSPSLMPEDLRGVSKDDLRQALTLVVGGLMGDLERYLGTRAQREIHPVEDGLDISRGQMNLSDGEFDQLKADLWSIIEPKTHYERTAGRKRRSFTYLFIPLE